LRTLGAFQRHGYDDMLHLSMMLYGRGFSEYPFVIGKIYGYII
jgi:hypothetical protein